MRSPKILKTKYCNLIKLDISKQFTSHQVLIKMSPQRRKNSPAALKTPRINSKRIRNDNRNVNEGEIDSPSIGHPNSLNLFINQVKDEEEVIILLHCLMIFYDNL